MTTFAKYTEFFSQLLDFPSVHSFIIVFYFKLRLCVYCSMNVEEMGRRLECQCSTSTLFDMGLVLSTAMCVRRVGL